MTTLQYLIKREQNLVDRKEQNFNDRVQLLYKLDECLDMSNDDRNELKDKVVSSESYEKALDTELKQVRMSMKRYFIKILEL